ncbi:hypothetical protein BaRGS_00031525 [Batillaria attramentaria]|uniref:Uncharacterized protein n=1 Tax=Batillaria attramentaria TaxID=370345 RepID=A0ABD0JQG3_9CAEN
MSKTTAEYSLASSLTETYGAMSEETAEYLSASSLTETSGVTNVSTAEYSLIYSLIDTSGVVRLVTQPDVMTVMPSFSVESVFVDKTTSRLMSSDPPDTSTPQENNSARLEATSGISTVLDTRSPSLSLPTDINTLLPVFTPQTSWLVPKTSDSSFIGKPQETVSADDKLKHSTSAATSVRSESSAANGPTKETTDSSFIEIPQETVSADDKLGLSTSLITSTRSESSRAHETITEKERLLETWTPVLTSTPEQISTTPPDVASLGTGRPFEITSLPVSGSPLDFSSPSKTVTFSESVRRTSLIVNASQMEVSHGEVGSEPLSSASVHPAKAQSDLETGFEMSMFTMYASHDTAGTSLLSESNERLDNTRLTFARSLTAMSESPSVLDERLDRTQITSTSSRMARSESPSALDERLDTTRLTFASSRTAGSESPSSIRQITQHDDHICQFTYCWVRIRRRTRQHNVLIRQFPYC